MSKFETNRTIIKRYQAKRPSAKLGMKAREVYRTTLKNNGVTKEFSRDESNLLTRLICTHIRNSGGKERII